MLLQRQREEVRELFAEPLAARVGRSVDEVREGGLEGGDFPIDSEVEVRLADGSRLVLRHAFAVVDEAQGVVGVGAEHGGYPVVGMGDSEVVERRWG
ncbi:hypothetical protein L6R53_33045 [Myxococcota bacterium]|nr:hypothetical protein [Myxococcota bacterium]